MLQVAGDGYKRGRQRLELVSWLVGQLDKLRLGIHTGQLNAVSVPPPP